MEKKWKPTCMGIKPQLLPQFRVKRASLGSPAELIPANRASGFVRWERGTEYSAPHRPPGKTAPETWKRPHRMTSLSRKKGGPHRAARSGSAVAATCGGQLRGWPGRASPSHSPQPPVFSRVSGSKLPDSEPWPGSFSARGGQPPRNILTRVIPALATSQQPGVNSLTHRLRDPRLGRPPPPAPPPSLPSAQPAAWHPAGTLGQCSPKGWVSLSKRPR